MRRFTFSRVLDEYGSIYVVWSSSAFWASKQLWRSGCAPWINCLSVMLWLLMYCDFCNKLHEFREKTRNPKWTRGKWMSREKTVGKVAQNKYFLPFISYSVQIEKQTIKKHVNTFQFQRMFCIYLLLLNFVFVSFETFQSIPRNNLSLDAMDHRKWSRSKKYKW